MGWRDIALKWAPTVSVVIALIAAAIAYKSATIAERALDAGTQAHERQQRAYVQIVELRFEGSRLRVIVKNFGLAPGLQVRSSAKFILLPGADRSLDEIERERLGAEVRYPFSIFGGETRGVSFKLPEYSSEQTLFVHLRLDYKDIFSVERLTSEVFRLAPGRGFENHGNFGQIR